MRFIRRGRKMTQSNNTHKNDLSIRLPDTLRATLESESARRGLSMSAIVREILMEHYEKRIR